MNTSAAVGLNDGVALLERAVSYTLGSLQLVTPDTLARPTPCSEWDVYRLLTHMNDSLTTLYEAADLGWVDPGWVDPGQSDDGQDACDHAGDGAVDCGGDVCVGLVRILKVRACRLLGAWTNGDYPDTVAVADHPLSTSVLAGTGAVEVAVHGWDLARGCGHDRPIPPGLADELLELAPSFVSIDDRRVRFAPAVGVPPSASSSDRLVAFLGRVPCSSFI